MNRWLYYFNEEELRRIKEIDDMYKKAKIIVDKVFLNDVDKGGNPYLDHLYHISGKATSKRGKTAGLLHDIVEDKNIKEEDLLWIGFESEIVDIVLIVTRDKDKETYVEYVDRVIDSDNIEAICLKKADLEDNMNLSRISNPTEKDYQRNDEKYKPQYRKIVKAVGLIEKKERVAC